MPTPAIIKGSDNFFTNIYTGNGGGQRVGKFQPFTDNGTIAKSCIFYNNSQLTRTPSSNGNRRTFTVSAWVKRSNLGSEQHICSSYDGSSSDNNSMWEFRFLAADTISISRYTDNILITNRTFEDTSKFYHVVMAVDTTQGTASNRVKLYVDGDEITSFGTDNRSSVGQNFDTAFNNTADAVVVGNRNGQSKYFDGYMSEVNLVDGTALTPSTFGLTDTSTGRWIPKSLTGITYGTNGFRLEFANSAGQTIGDDTSGNTNDLTVANLAATDITTDSPTQNHATLAVNGPNIASTFSEGNLKVTLPTNSTMTGGLSTLKMVSGKYYMEATATSVSSAGLMLGIMGSDTYADTSDYAGKLSDSYSYYSVNGTLYNATASVSFGNSFTTNDIIGIAVDLDNNQLYFSKNGTFQNSANPSAGTGGQSIRPAKSTTAGFYRFSFTDAGTGSTDIVTANFGQKSFSYTAPTGFNTLQQDNLPTTGKGIPGFTWIKERSDTSNHQIYDSNRGAGELLMSSSSNAETTRTDALYKFLKGGYAVGDNSSINGSGDDVVAWNWIGNGGTTTANTDGSGATLASTIQANPTAGFSIVTYAGSSSGAKTVAHGLSKIPEMIWIKNRTDNSKSWFVYHINASYASMVPYDGNAHYYLNLDGSGARGNGDVFNNTAPTNKVFSIQAPGTSTNGNGKNFLAYCFHSVHGYSQIGKYLGNGSADGTFVYTGFKPSWLMVKCLSPSGTNWIVWDNTRSTFNPRDNVLYPDLTQAETTSGNDMDFYANGFKARGTNGNYNTSSRNYTYMAFAEHPLEGNGTNSATAL